MTGIPDKLWHDAVHLAGRAVIARAFGLYSSSADLFLDAEEQPVAHAFIVDALQASDWSRRHPERKEGDRAFWRGRIIASMAGGEAERQIIGSSTGGDEVVRRDLINIHLGHPDDWRETSARMRRFARQLVTRHRAAIIRFAEQLVAADELDELLAGEKHAA